MDRSAFLIELAESGWLVSSSGAEYILDEFVGYWVIEEDCWF